MDKRKWKFVHRSDYYISEAVTLMVDFPGVPGKMCDWEMVQVVEGAEEALRCTSRHAKIYIATGASESTVLEIKTAFKRVGLDTFISGYFCKSNLGIGKSDPAFYACILDHLAMHPSQVTMVGDSLSKDIEPALAQGMNVIWLSKDKADDIDDNIRVISSLEALCV